MQTTERTGTADASRNSHNQYNIIGVFGEIAREIQGFMGLFIVRYGSRIEAKAADIMLQQFGFWAINSVRKV